MPCNFNLRRLWRPGSRTACARPAARRWSSTPIAISDGITMGTEGMKASLVSRELIADSMELMARGLHVRRARSPLVGCDKTIPAGAMALLRLNLPGVLLYGGSIMPGRLGDRDLTIQDVYEAVGAHAAGKITDDELKAVEDFACPGAGACGGQFTANTMALAMEFLGLAAMGTAGVPAEDPRKGDVGYWVRRAGHGRAAPRRPPARHLRPAHAFENAIAGVATTGGSTNAVLHLLAIAHEADVPLDIDDFDRVSDSHPAARRSCGPAAGMRRPTSTARVAHAWLPSGWSRAASPTRAAMTVTGRTFAEEAALAEETPGQDVVRQLDNPIKSTGGLVILHGSLAPEGCVVKVAGHERLTHTGPARVFDREEDAMAAVTRRQDPALATWWSFATRARAVAQACARCWA